MSKELANASRQDLSASRAVWDRYEILASETANGRADWARVFSEYRENANRHPSKPVFTKSEGIDVHKPLLASSEHVVDNE